MAETRKFAPGARVIVRDEEWLVKATLPASVGGVAVRAVGLSELVRDHEALFLSELDEITELRPEETTLVDDKSAQYRQTRLYLESLLRRTPPTDDHIYLGHRGAIDYAPYQVTPAHRALQALRPRILIADGVGLGKTIEVGILLSELIKRGRGERILVVAVRSMLTQFQQEIWARFAIPLVRLDSVGLQRVRARIPSNKNPFTYYDRVIISIDTLKNDAQYRHYLEQCRWDVIVIDECHNVANAGSQRNRLAGLLARTCDSLILTSATPHNGRAESFANLMNMLEPTAIADVTSYAAEEIAGLFTRRFKKDIEREVAGHFSERRTELIRLPASPAEEQFFARLATAVFHTLRGDAAHDDLFRVGLLKAFLSSPDACQETIRGRIQRVQRQLERLRGRHAQNEPASTTEEELGAEIQSHAKTQRREGASEAEEMAPDMDVNDELQPALLGDEDRRQRAIRILSDDLATLSELRDLAAAVTPGHFTKHQHLLSLLRAIGADAAPSAQRVIIFSERIATLDFLQQQLCAAFGAGPDAVVKFHAGLPDVEQQQIVEDFGKEDSPMRILLASDVASEGVNLHYYCHLLVHFDIPWSLITLEQRNGRIDRYGQLRTPTIHYLLTLSEVESIKGDLRILERLIEKEQEVYKNIGDAAVLLGLHDSAREEEYLTKGAASGKSAEELLPADPQEPEWWLAIMEQVTQETQAADLRKEAMSLFPDDLAFARAAFEELLETDQLDRAPEFHPQRPEFSLLAPEDLRRRCRSLPDEALPPHWTFELSTDRDRIKSAIVAARRRHGQWPQVQLFWELHPVMEWLLDKLMVRFGRREAPIILTPQLQPDEYIILFQGILSNKRSQPVITAWFGLLKDEHGWNVLPLDETLAFSGFGDGLANRGRPSTRREEIQRRLPAAVEQARQHMAEHRRRRADEERKRLMDDQRKLRRWHEAVARRIESQRDGAIGARRTRLQFELDEAEKLFQGRSKWVSETYSADENAYLRVAAVFTGA